MCINHDIVKYLHIHKGVANQYNSLEEECKSLKIASSFYKPSVENSILIIIIIYMHLNNSVEVECYMYTWIYATNN